MIGDDVGYRKYPNPVVKHIVHSWHQLECYVRGHFYRPSYVQIGSKVRYRCDRCGTPTDWMNREEHKLFNLEQCPTWGERGSDSQGYRFIGPIQKYPKRNQIGKKRKRYRKTA
jgi:hypothetical protein